jgi:hypothetical protein
MKELVRGYMKLCMMQVGFCNFSYNFPLGARRGKEKERIWLTFFWPLLAPSLMYLVIFLDTVSVSIAVE